MDTATKEAQHGVIIVDTCDADLLVKAYSCKSSRGSSYYSRIPRVMSVRWIHRVIMSRVLDRPLNPKEQVDHINGNGLDNRRDNLRLATRSQNCANKRLGATNTSGLKGVCWHKATGKWMAQIKVNQKLIYLGVFTNPSEAHAVYIAAARQYFGEFANDGKGGVK